MSETSPLVVGQSPAGDDLLWQQLKSIPAFRALLRSVEARFYQVLDLPQPVLDVGCGDGHFAQVTFEPRITAGIDPWWGPLQKARRSGMYELPLQALGDALPFADSTFASAFSNSVLEHIPDLQPVLSEVSRVLKPGAPFVLTAPSHYFTKFLGGADLFENIGLNGAAEAYRKGFNRISRHAHTDPPEIWAERLALAGFKIERWQYYFSKEALRTLELGHAQGIPSAVLHALTGHWIIGPWRSNLKWTEQWVRPYFEEPFPDKGAYLFFLARKEADAPLEAALPAPQPYTLEELTAASFPGAPSEVTPPAVPSKTEERVTAAETASEENVEALAEAPSRNLRWLIPGSLVTLALLFAAMGQLAWRAAPEQPFRGLQWFALSALALLAISWFHHSGSSPVRSWRWPSPAAVPRRRFLSLPALLLAFVAYRLALPNTMSAFLPLALWSGAILLGFYSLDLGPARQNDAIRRTLPEREERLTAFKISVLLFLIALLLRVYDLAHLPFILNGTEASMGLSALDVLNGLQHNPFSTGWLTNPTLPFFLQAIPLALFGPTTAAIRLLSAFVGALTVPVIFLIGRRLYGRGAGLAAAVLLMGSHFHIHYSRSGLTNAWDGLFVLLALGLIAAAWQKPAPEARRTWLLAGLFTGLNAYLYTSSHLLPIMLAALALLVILFDRATLRKQWRNVLATAMLTLIVALPQTLFYRANPGIYMERANALGILSRQTGWLNEETLRSGASQFEVLAGQFWRAALAFNATLDTGTSYGPLVPLLDFVFGALFILGLILALFRLRRLSYSMLVIWVVVTIVFAGALLLDPPESRRLIIAMPAVCLLAAIALRDLAAALFSDRSAAGEGAASLRNTVLDAPVATAIILTVCIAIALSSTAYYFGSFRSENHFADRNTEIANGVADYLNELDGQWIAQFYGPPYMYADFPTIPFLARGFTSGENLFDVPEGGMPSAGNERSNQVFFFVPERLGELEQLRAVYPSGTEQTLSGYYADPLFTVYQVTGNP